MFKLLPTWLSRAKSGNAPMDNRRGAIVRLIDAPLRSPATTIEQNLASTIARAGAVSFATLVESVAADLYDEELHHGAAVLDLGLFGKRLFTPDVVGELYAANGVLWKIEVPRHEA